MVFHGARFNALKLRHSFKARAGGAALMWLSIELAQLDICHLNTVYSRTIKKFATKNGECWGGTELIEFSADRKLSQYNSVTKKL